MVDRLTCLRSLLLALAAVSCAASPAQDPATDADGGTTFAATATDEGSTAHSSFATDSEGWCGTWCDNDYPSDNGCDEEDDGVNAEAGEESGGADDTSAGMGDDLPLATRVYDLRRGEVPVGIRVELASVVVTAPPAPQPGGAGVMFTVAEAEGGPYSGITVRAPSSFETAALQVGDLVDVVGRHHERYVFALIEAEYDGVVTTGVGTLPDPVVIPSEDIATLSIGGEAATSLESVVVRILQPEVVDTDGCAGEIEIQAALRIDDRFLVASGQTLPAPEAPIYASIMGPLLYTFNGFEVAPRTLADIQE